MLTKDELKERKNSIWGYSRQLVYEIIESHLELYAKLEKAEVEIAEMKESHALQIDAVIKCNKELAKLKQLVEGKDERR